MGILEGKRILVAGITRDDSIGYAIAREAIAEGATVLVTQQSKMVRLTTRVVSKLDPTPVVLPLDVGESESLAALPGLLREHVDGLDGVVHSIAYGNPETTLGGRFLDTEWPDVATALQVSSYSLKSLTMACRPLLGRGSSVVGLTFDGSVAWPVYDWMGVAKAALEGVSRYLARYLGPDGIRCNLVSAGPLETLSKKAIPGSETFNHTWDERAPLGWSLTDTTPTAKAVVALLSDWFPATTAEVIHVDGGVHAMGA